MSNLTGVEERLVLSVTLQKVFCFVYLFIFIFLLISDYNESCEEILFLRERFTFPAKNLIRLEFWYRALWP